MTAANTNHQPSDALALALTGLEPSSAVTLRSAFESMFAQAEEWTARAKGIVVTDLSQTREMKFARESRLALKEIRVNAEKTRKRLKEDSLRQGKAIDGMANVLKALVEPIEAHLLEQEQFAERVEAAEKEALRKARSAAIVAYGEDPTVYANLGETSEEAWASILENARAAHEAKAEAARRAEAVRIEAERIAAEKREVERQLAIKAEAERAERERAQAAENARLRREADEREAAAAEERRVANEALAVARAARERAEAEAAAAKAAEAERTAAEEARLAREEAERAHAAAAPDREKLAAFAAHVRGLTLPALTSPKGAAVLAKLGKNIESLAAWIEKAGGDL